MKIAKHRNGSLDTIKLRALLHIQKFTEYGDDDFGGIGLPGGGNWKPVPGAEGGGARLYIQHGSRMKDLPVDDDESPF